jgi:hypothetical protein
MPNNFPIDIINPNNPAGEKVQAIFPYAWFSHLYKFYPIRYKNLEVAKFVLQNPKRIFSGIRHYNQGGWCFTGKPVLWHIRENVQAPFPDNLIFTVYLNPRLYIYEARAENCANDDNLCPEDWKNRYGGLIWKSIS